MSVQELLNRIRLKSAGVEWMLQLSEMLSVLKRRSIDDALSLNWLTSGKMVSKNQPDFQMMTRKRKIKLQLLTKKKLEENHSVSS